ncbi:M23 family metallopeptidase [Psychroserpens mesophilus]|uniref:M23 family metallopeptidase n=1 Tax=Psychroserpens mesophilus TaxID=325473 RepID=UPI003D647F07
MKRILLIVTICFTIQLVNSQKLKGFKQIKSDTLYISLINPFLAPVEINLTALDSTKSYVKINPYGLLKEKDTLNNALAIPLERIKDTANVKLNEFLDFTAKFGTPNETYDTDYEYELPFLKGKRYKIIQSFGGKFSHNKPHSKYAVDIGIPIGDTITAARKGKVYYVKEDSKEHCKTRKCIDMANKIYIIHQDGTMAHYLHLDFKGALVDEGDIVEANQPIGISGMTGFTTIPHLHFVLYKARSISIPFRFKSIKHKILKHGKYYRND